MKQEGEKTTPVRGKQRSKKRSGVPEVNKRLPKGSCAEIKAACDKWLREHGCEEDFAPFNQFEPRKKDAAPMKRAVAKHVG